MPVCRWVKDSVGAQGSLEVTGSNEDHQPQPTAGPLVSNSGQAAEYQSLQSSRPGAQEAGFQGKLDSERGKWNTREKPSRRDMDPGQCGSGTCCGDSPDPGPPSLALKYVGVVRRGDSQAVWLRPSEEPAQFCHPNLGVGFVRRGNGACPAKHLYQQWLKEVLRQMSE